jgi:DNA-binding beta-propeller fold protein YncE
MSGGNPRLIPLWAWAAVALAAVGAVAWLGTSGSRPDPPEAYRYDVSAYEEVDPALVIATELDSITPDVPGLRALAATPDGRVYAAGENILLIYGPDSAEIARHPVTGTPECLAVGPDGTVFLGMLTHVETMGPDGSPGAAWPPVEGQPHLTSIIADDASVYMADAGNRVVWRFSHAGELLGQIGEKDAARDIPGLVVPSPCLDVAFDESGALWVTNPGRHGLEQYRPGGEMVASWYRASMDIDGFCGCCNPSHVAFRPDGTLVTAEKGLVRVKLYSADHRLLGVVAPPQAFRSGPTGPFSPELEAPVLDLAVDARGRVLVVDANRNAIRVFETKENP